MSHLTQFSLISRQVVHSLHHLTWIRGFFVAGGHSQCGLTTHMTQLQYFSAAGGNNMAPTISHLTQLSQISRQVVHSLHHLTWIRGVSAAGGHSLSGQTPHLTQLQSFSAAGRNNMALPMSHLTRFSLISRQVVHSLHHLTWIRDIFAAGGHSHNGQTAHLTQLQSVSEAGGYNMAPSMSHLTQLSQISRQVVHSLHHLAWIRGVSAAGGKIL